MNLIEKLARESAQTQNLRVDDGDTAPVAEEAYANGFRKARDMAAEKVETNQYDYKTTAEAIRRMGDEPADTA